VSARWVLPADRGPLVFEPVGRAEAPAGRRAVFVDRDGVLNEGTPDPDSGLLESPLRVADVRLLPGVAAALHDLAQAGYALVCVSNQPAAAKSKATVGQLRTVHERVIELLALEGVCLDVSLLCPHHPEGVVDELSGPCACRKPAPGMLLDAAGVLSLDLCASWMLGDTDADIRAGDAAGCRTVLIEYPGSAHKRSDLTSPDLRAANLVEGVAQLLGRGLDLGPG
jgi:D-glycero-D-manno-heptose 1,7-bisphosphate phosphatase